MKILLLDNSSLTPVKGDYCIDAKTGIFAKELQSLGNEVTMYGQKVAADNTSHTYPLLKNGLKVKGLKRKKNKLQNYILLYLYIIPVIAKQDFVYIFYPSAYKYVALLCRIFRKKYGLYIRGEQGLNDDVSHWIYKNGQAVFTVTDHFTDFVNNITRKQNAYTIRPMIPFTEKDIVWDRVYSDEGVFKILYLGRMTVDKGLMELINAVNLLRKREHNFILTMVGDGGFMPEIEAAINELKLDDCVRLIGSVDDADVIAEYYKTSDIYILPSYHEGFPRTLYEAMIFGTPIITSFVGGIRGLMKDGYNCIRIEPKSVESIVGGLEFAFDNYDKMVEYAENGRATVAKIVDSRRPTHAEHLNEILKG